MEHIDEGRLHAYADGAFDRDEAEYVEIGAHLASCPACAARLGEAVSLREASRQILRQLDPVDAPDSRAALPVHVPRPAMRVRWVMPYARAAVVLLALGLGWSIRDRAGSIWPSVESATLDLLGGRDAPSQADPDFPDLAANSETPVVAETLSIRRQAPPGGEARTTPLPVAAAQDEAEPARAELPNEPERIAPRGLELRAGATAPVKHLARNEPATTASPRLTAPDLALRGREAASGLVRDPSRATRRDLPGSAAPAVQTRRPPPGIPGARPPRETPGMRGAERARLERREPAWHLASPEVAARRLGYAPAYVEEFPVQGIWVIRTSTGWHTRVVQALPDGNELELLYWRAAQDPSAPSDAHPHVVGEMQHGNGTTSLLARMNEAGVMLRLTAPLPAETLAAFASALQAGMEPYARVRGW